MTRKAHVLFEGYLSDAPGRNESWTESVTYLGSNRWRLVVEGSTFDGSDSAERQVERMGTRALIKWCIERDEDNARFAASRSLTADFEEVVKAEVEGGGETLGERAAHLLDVARSEKAVFCVACLEGWVAGTWPPKKRMPVPRVLSIDGVAKRGVWLGVYRPAYRVETTHGRGFMEELGSNGYAVFLREGPGDPVARSARITRRLMPQLKKWQAEFEALKASLAARSSVAVRISGESD